MWGFVKPATVVPVSAAFMLALGGLVALGCPAAEATEAAGTNIALGGTTFQTAVMPDPGLYYSAYLNFYSSSRINDGDGQRLIPDYYVESWLEYNQLLYVLPIELGDFRIGVGLVAPLVRVRQSAGDFAESVEGLADLLVQPLIIGWNHGRYHALMAQGFYAPIGQYDRFSDLNIGRNTWQYQPQLSLGYSDPEGVEATVTISYVISETNQQAMVNFTNPTKSPYRSGQEFEADFALGYNVAPNFEFGLTGYYYQQTTPDKLTDPAANAIFQALYHGYNSRALALGLGTRALTDIGEFMVQIDQEIKTSNRTQGTSVWARWNIAF